MIGVQQSASNRCNTVNNPDDGEIQILQDAYRMEMPQFLLCLLGIHR